MGGWFLKAGTGAPEGKVTAPPGGIYVDTASTAGAVRWIKTQGTGNTGWKVEYGDTGWRDITAGLHSTSPVIPGVGGAALIRRIADQVTLRLRGPLTVRVASGASVFTSGVPGNRLLPGRNQDLLSPRGMTFSLNQWGVLLTSPTEIALTDRQIDIHWNVDTLWPSVLPGIPA